MGSGSQGSPEPLLLGASLVGRGFVKFFVTVRAEMMWSNDFGNLCFITISGRCTLDGGKGQLITVSGAHWRVGEGVLKGGHVLTV